MHHLQTHAWSRAFPTLVLALFVLLAACSDSPPTTAPSAPDPAQLRGPSVRDASIRRDDSHFAARVRISRSTDDSGASLRLAGAEMATALAEPPSETVYVEGGYGTSGEIHFGVYWDQVNPAFGAAGMRAVGDRVELISASGAVVSSQPFDAQMAEAGLPGGTLVGAFFPTGEPGPITCPPSDPLCGTGSELRDAGAADAAAVGDSRLLRRVHRRAARSGGAATNDDRSEVTRRYRKVSADGWRLEEVRHTDHVTTDQGPRVTTTVMQVTYGAWHRNAARDAARAARPRARAGVARAPLARPAVATDAALLEQLCAPSNYNVDIARSKSTKGLGILYQHGFCSNASTFDGMRPRLSSAFTVQRERAFSIASTVPAEDQVDSLIRLVRASGARKHLVIGHSLGGLVGRRLGQRDPALVSGVITIGTPNLGALAADLAPEFAADVLNGAVGSFCVGAWLCEAISTLLVEQNAGRLLYGAPGLLPPVIEDLSTGSAFLQTLNTTHETFPRAGIEVNAGNRWALFRMVGDLRSPRHPVVFGQRPLGQRWVETAEEVYLTARFLQLLAVFMRFEVAPYGGGVDCSQSGYAAFWTPCGDSDWDTAWDVPSFQDVISYLIYHLSTIVIRTMDLIDVSWDWITTRNSDFTDGLIALRSQRYPSSPGTYAPIRVLITPPDADSHSGQTASPRVVDRTIDLVRALGVGGQ